MRLSNHRIRNISILAILCLILITSGCSYVGPKSISQGRLSYAEAINRTEDQQMLLTIVKGRYRESSTLLAVNSVAANMRFRSSVEAQFGFGDEEDYLGNLVPLSTGVAYEENPTITYTPVHGEQYFKQLMSPVPLDLLMVTLRSMTNSEHVLNMMVNRANDLRNPDFLDEASIEPSQEFKRFAELFDQLHNPGILDVVKNPADDVVFDLLIYDYAPNYTAQVKEFLTLLDLPMPKNESEIITIPVSFAIRRKGAEGIGIITRSTFDLIEIMKASVEVPVEHIDTGLAYEYPPMGLPGQGIRIKASQTKPEGLSLAVKYRGYWFYVDETDQISKGAFLVMRTFWSITTTSATGQQEAPVLTIPVSR